MMLWAVGGLVLFLAIGGAALQIAIARDGPAVLSALDRLTGPSGDAVRVATISTGNHAQQKLIVWGSKPRQPAATPRPVLVFVHGGSWRTGAPESYGFIARTFVAKGFIVVLGGYRLGEDGKYPAMIADTARVIGWVHREIAQYGGDPERIVIAGHSAGAYNVAMAALEEKWMAREGLSTSDIAGVVGLAGPYDFYPFDSDSTKAAFGDASDPETTQPIAHVRSNAPPMLLIHGAKDDLVKVRNTRELARRIKAAGGTAKTRIYPEKTHNDPLIALASPWRADRDVAELIAQFVHAVTSNRAPPYDVSVPVQDQTG